MNKDSLIEFVFADRKRTYDFSTISFEDFFSCNYISKRHIWTTRETQKISYNFITSMAHNLQHPMKDLFTRLSQLDIDSISTEELERLLPEFGMNNGILHEMPSHLSDYFGKGLHFW